MEENSVVKEGQLRTRKIKGIFFGVLVLVLMVGSGIALWLYHDFMTSVNSYFEAGKVAFQNEDYREAVNNFKMAAIEDSEVLDIQALLARSLAEQARAESDMSQEEKEQLFIESILHFEKAVALGLNERSSGYYEFLFNYLIASLYVGQYAQAEGLFSKILIYDPIAVSSRLRMADAYINRIGKPEAARDALLPIFLRPVTDKKLRVEANFLMMRLSTYFEIPDDIERYAKAALAEGISGSDLALVYTNLAGAYSRRMNVEKAKEYILKAEEVVGEPGRFSCNLASVYFTNEKLDLALEEAKKLAHPICWSIQAKVYLELGDKAATRMYAQKSLDAISAIEIKDIFALRGIQKEEEILRKAQEE